MIIAERPSGTFSRQVLLGETLDAEHITADYAAGVLTLTIPVGPRLHLRVLVALPPVRHSPRQGLWPAWKLTKDPDKPSWRRATLPG